MSYRSKVAIVYLLGFFVDLINMFIANVAYPAIGHAMQASVSQLAWLSNGYILGLTLVIPLSAWLAQRIGGRRVFLLSLTLFILATAAAGNAGSIGELIGWRVLQGMGGGLLIPIGQTLTYQLFRSHERAGLSAAIMLVGLLAPALSPALGGWIVDRLDWRWVFFANLPLAALALLLAALWLRVEAPGAERKPLDGKGLFSACLALTLLLLGLTRLSESGHQGSGALVLAIGALTFGYYLRHSLRTPQPLLNLRLVGDPLLRSAMMIYQCIPGLFIGVSLVAMLYLQNQLGMHAAQVGALMLPWSLASFLAITLTGKTFNRLGPRPLLLAGCLLQGLGILALAQIAAADQQALQVAAFALMGLGGSLCSSTAQSSAFLHVPDAQLADASALWNINRQLSFCLGVALLSLLLNLLLHWLPPAIAYHYCFYFAAASTLLPMLLCLRIANRAIVRHLKAQQESL
ncbi:MFS transporter [Serratia entomophila]|uniref:MFS transporter n=1 Tax=Serratia entomophila TaxID=42906 RepID=UPI00217AA9A0|nr:MFS transporter [Serratia entomophila]CAI1073976.1 High-copy suppressor of rspA [Serratia entomophila]CAI1094564.1 High-copy suppressor of rspA [Serratia entomophila]CAI1098003.1 High-copy suppressor of rspA [Serratia entomophila]CAI1864011.1 High-copy suppressor of rspA [Serratia entomophila]CAI1898596.1 High-copy suppressor of rspA [Serratia entomophila]